MLRSHGVTLLGLLLVSILTSCSTAHLKHPAVVQSEKAPWKVRSSLIKAAKAHYDSSFEARALADTAIIVVYKSVRESIQKIHEANRTLRDQHFRTETIYLSYLTSLPKYDRKEVREFWIHLDEARPGVEESIRTFNEDTSIRGATSSMKALLSSKKLYRSALLGAYGEYERLDDDGRGTSDITDITMVVDAIAYSQRFLAEAVKRYESFVDLKQVYQSALATLPHSGHFSP